ERAAVQLHEAPDGRGARDDRCLDPARADARRGDGVSATASRDVPRVGRDGALHLDFERRGPATVVAGCRFTLPLQVLAPVALDDPAAVVSILNPTGGLVGGDRLAIDVRPRPRAPAALPPPPPTPLHPP